MFLCALILWFMVRSKRDVSPFEGHFRVKTIMAAILNGRSKPKCSNLATLKGPSELRISKSTTDGHFGLPWSFVQILSTMTVPPCVHEMMTQKGISRNSCLVPNTRQPFELSLRRVSHLKGLEPFRIERRDSIIWADVKL